MRERGFRNVSGAVLSTDPPYYDNVPYADISDFFYVWLRRNLRDVWPDECSTLLPHQRPTNWSLTGTAPAQRKRLRSTSSLVWQSSWAQVARSRRRCRPATIYYAFKATEYEDGQIRTTGWDTFLQAVIDAGIQVNATWPVRTERGTRQRLPWLKCIGVVDRPRVPSPNGVGFAGHSRRVHCGAADRTCPKRCG